jgi:predicted RNA binding protein YcfA (HicA-like mRNA interferase family)
MCLDKKIVVKVLKRNGFKRIYRNGRGLGSSHNKYQRINVDGTTTSCVLVGKKSLGRNILRRQIIHDISKITGIPVEEFYRSGGSKKHQNGIGTFGLINNTTMMRG